MVEYMFIYYEFSNLTLKIIKHGVRELFIFAEYVFRLHSYKFNN